MKQDARKLQKEAREQLRLNIISMVNAGHKKGEIAKVLGVDKNTVSNTCKRYKADGLSGLKDKKPGVSSESASLLNDKQEKLIQKLITDTMPDQLKLDFALWTRKAVKELIERELGILLAVTTVGDYLRKWGYTPQKPKKRAYEQSPKAVEKWLNESYPTIKQRAKEEDAQIEWCDETGVKNQCNHGRSYAPKGKTPVKSSMSKRFSANMISTVNNQGRVQFMIYKDNMNSELFIRFLEQLIKAADKKVFLILDNLKVHHSQPVKDWVEENKEKIELFFLPSYSPERNPDEYLNCDLKQGLSNKKSPKDQQQLIYNVLSHMNMLQHNPERVKKYFNHKDIQYAA